MKRLLAYLAVLSMADGPRGLRLSDPQRRDRRNPFSRLRMEVPGARRTAGHAGDRHHVGRRHAGDGVGDVGAARHGQDQARLRRKPGGRDRHRVIGIGRQRHRGLLRALRHGRPADPGEGFRPPGRHARHHRRGIEPGRARPAGDAVEGAHRPAGQLSRPAALPRRHLREAGRAQAASLPDPQRRRHGGGNAVPVHAIHHGSSVQRPQQGEALDRRRRLGGFPGRPLADHAQELPAL